MFVNYNWKKEAQSLCVYVCLRALMLQDLQSVKWSREVQPRHTNTHTLIQTRTLSIPLSLSASVSCALAHTANPLSFSSLCLHFPFHPFFSHFDVHPLLLHSFIPFFLFLSIYSTSSLSLCCCFIPCLYLCG